MRRTLLLTFAAAILSAAIFAGRTEAAAPTAAALNVPAAPAMLRVATAVCGGNGCVTVQTKAPQRRKFHPLGHG